MMMKNFEPGCGYIELNPDLNDSYDMESGEGIYVPSDYPFDIPKVYLKGFCCDSLCRNADSVISIRGNILTLYTQYEYSDEDYEVVEYNLDTLEKKEYKVTLNNTSQMGMRDYYNLVDFIDPNIIKRININIDTNPI